jgi:hypothetical protein
VIVTPATVSIPANGAQQFQAQVFDSGNQKVVWLVNGVRGGAPSIGVISDSGLYTAPPDSPQQITVEVEAESAAPSASGQANATVGQSPYQPSNYYVATTGNDGNPGSLTKPWRTMQHAVDAAPPGASILVRGGVYNELVTITRSGSAAAGFLSLEAYPNEAPTIDGTGLGVPGGQWGLVTIDSASFVRIAGFEIRNYRSASTALVPIGVYVFGAGNHIEILNNHIHDIVTTVTTSSGDALGIAIYGTEAPASIEWVTIDGNELDHLTTGFSESLSLSGNVELWQVTNNLIHDNDNIGVNAEGFFQTAPAPAYDQARRGFVGDNTIYNITSVHNPAYGDTPGADGVYVDGGTLVTVARNLIHNADIGIEMASEIHGRETSGVWTHDNVIHHSLVTGISLGGANPNQNGGSTGCVVANNTLYANDTTLSGSGEFQIQYNAGGNLFYNNILFANSQGLLVNAFAKGSAPPAAFDHNLYFSPDGAAGSQWIWLGKSYSSFSAYKAGTAESGAAEDAHSRFANPQFADATTGDFAIASTSPAVALGVNLGLAAVGLVDFAGQPRLTNGALDAGALQH